jgi:uncharacterized protein YaiI (UPF0178 family)
VTRKKTKQGALPRDLSSPLNLLVPFCVTRKIGNTPWSCVEGVWYTFAVKIYIDADGAPWRDLVIEQAKGHGVTVVIVADYSHDFPPAEGVERVVVDGGVDAADFAIINRVQEGDLVITQDVGLASLVLPKGATVISPRGHEFTEDSMGGRLALRWLHGRIRKAGGRVKGPRSFAPADRDQFLSLLERKISASKRRADEAR